MPRMPAPGDQFGRYTLGRELGEGGMGRVFVATDTQLGREVAVKVIQPGIADQAAHRARFEREAAILARMDSPHVVQVYDYGESDDTFYLVTQLVGGGDLFQRVRGAGPLPPSTALRLLAEVADGLDHAHGAGVTHRDVKPSNVLLRADNRGDEAVLCDFGIASGPGLELTRTGMISGSLLYMAAERHRGEPGSVAGDVYSAGCLLWFTLTGAAPYTGTEFEIALAHQDSPIPQLEGKSEFVKRVNQILRRSMAKAPRDRYRSMRAMHADLVAVEPLAPAAIAVPDRTQLRRPTVTRRRFTWAPVAAAAAVAVIALVVALIAVVSGRGPDMLDPTAQGSEESTSAGSPTASSDARNPADQTAGAKPIAPAGSLLPVPPGEPGGELPGAPGDDTTPPAGQPSAQPSSRPSTQAPNQTAAPSQQPTTQPAPAPAPAPAPSSTAPPSPLYRCWNGKTSSTYRGCGTPTGYVGLRWMFPAVNNLRNCQRTNPSSYSGYTKTVVQCDAAGEHFRLLQFKTRAAVYNFQNASFNGRGANRDWAFGKSWRYATQGPRRQLQNHSNAYSQLPWGALVWTNEGWAVVNRMLSRLSYRDPGDYRGIRIR